MYAIRSYYGFALLGGGGFPRALEGKVYGRGPRRAGEPRIDKAPVHQDGNVGAGLYRDRIGLDRSLILVSVVHAEGKR